MATIERMGETARLSRGRLVLGPVAAAAVLLSTGAVAAAVLLSTGAVAVEEPAPVIAVAPGTVTVLTGDPARVDVVIDNSSAAAVVATSLDAVAPPRVTASVADITLPATIAAHSSLVAHLDVVTTAELSEAQVGVVLTYRAAADGSPARSVTSTLTVSATAAAAPALTFLVAPDTLNDGEARLTTVRIDNTSARAYTDLSLTALDGDDVSIEMLGDPVKPFTTCADDVGIVCLAELPPGTSATVELRLRAHERVRTGSQQVGLRLTATPAVDPAKADAGPPNVTTTATHEVTLAVFGVDALSPFGLGTLFVLPGVLAVVVFMIGNSLYPRTKAVPDQVELKDLRQLPLVVGASVVAYGLVFVVFGRNLTRRVSTLDVGVLLILGACLGLAAWASLALLYRHFVGRKIFRLDDDPVKVLRRLQALDASLNLPSFVSSGITYVHIGAAPEGKALAAPQMAFHFTEAAQGAKKDTMRSLLLAANGRGEIGPVLDAEKQGLVELRWVTASGVRTFDDGTFEATAEANVLKEEVLAGH